MAPRGQKTKNDRDTALEIGGSGVPVEVTADTTLTAAQTDVEATVPAVGSITITLPPVKEAKGRFFSIKCVSDGGGTGIAVQDGDDAIITGNNYAAAGNGLTAVGDYLLLYCDGLQYIALATNLT